MKSPVFVSFLALLAGALPAQAASVIVEGGFDTVTLLQGTGEPSVSCDGCTARVEGDRIVISADTGNTSTVVTGPGTHTVTTIGPNGSTTTTSIGSITSVVTGVGASSTQNIGGNTTVVTGGGTSRDARAEITVSSLESLSINGSVRSVSSPLPTGQVGMQGVFDSVELGPVGDLALAMTGNGTATVAALDGTGRISVTGGGSVIVQGGHASNVQAKTIGQGIIRVLGQVDGGSAQCIGSGGVEMANTTGPISASRIGSCQVITR